MGYLALSIALIASFLGLCIATVQIEPNVRHLYLREGSTVQLNCTVTDHKTNTALVFWDTGLNKDVTPYEVLTLNPETNVGGTTVTYTIKRLLTIVNFSSKYNGKYTCNFKENSNTVTADIELKAIKENRSHDVYHFGNETVTLFCNTDLGADVEFQHWIKYNVTVEEGEKYKINKEDGSLMIKDLDRDDAARYIARYKIKSTDKTYDCIVDYTAGPLVLDMDKSINREEEESVTIDCVVKGWPRAKVTWMKGDTVVQASDRITFHQHKDVDGARLVISDLKFDDEGIYKCHAHSERFNASAEKSIKLRVKDKLAWLWPFLGIIAEAVVLVLLILFFEKVKGKKTASGADHPHAQ